MISIIGMITLITIAFILCNNRRAINIKTVTLAFLTQFLIGGFVLYSSIGEHFLTSISNGVGSVVGYADEGIRFVFGSFSNQEFGFVFFIRVLPVIIFFSSLIAVLYHLKIMQWVITLLGGMLQKILGTSKPESLSATANIFLAMTESPLVIRPFIKSLTQSELFAVMACGLASVSGSVLAGYVGLGINIKYLIAASFMSAPGGLLMAKIMFPETQKQKNDYLNLSKNEEDNIVHTNVIDAAAHGASIGLNVAAHIGAMLLAFISLIAMCNGILSYLGGFIGYPGITFQHILGYIFSPLAYLLGIPWSEAITAGSFIGEKLILNEFVAYLDFSHYLTPTAATAAGVKVLSEHSQVIITFALCGFANFASIAMLVGGLGTLAPTRRTDVAKMGIKAVIAGTLSNLMSATIAGFFIMLAH